MLGLLERSVGFSRQFLPSIDQIDIAECLVLDK